MTLSDVAPQEFLHVECDCVPNLGPSHCHLCSASDHVIRWPCAYADAMAAHDREVAEKAWDEGQKSGLRYTDRMRAAYEIGRPELPGPPSDNPYRGTPEQEGKGAEIDEAEVERIAQAATAHNSGQTVYEVSRPSGILRVVMSSWPRAKEAYTALAGAGYRVAQDGNNVMVLAAPTESEGTP